MSGVASVLTSVYQSVQIWSNIKIKFHHYSEQIPLHKMEKDYELTANQKKKMMSFVEYVNSGNELRYKYIAMLQRDYKPLFDEDKQERKCQHCGQIFIGKAYGPHVKRMHADIIRKRRNQELQCE